MDKQLVDMVYAAAVDDAALAELLELLAKVWGSRAVGVFAIEQGEMVWHRDSGMPDGFLEEFASEYLDLDPRVGFMLACPRGMVLSDAAPEMRPLLEEAALGELLSDYDLPFTAGAFLDGGRQNRQVFYLSRSRDQGAPDPALVEAMQEIVPHVSRSMKLRARHRALALASTNQVTGEARMLLNATGRLIWMDPAAEAILSHAGLVQVRSATVRWRNPLAQAWFRGGLRLARSRARPDWIVDDFRFSTPDARYCLKLLPASGGLHDQLALVVSWRRPSALAPTLTPRQFEVLELLAAGLSSAEAAARLGCAQTTMRNHAQALLERFEAHSRVEMLKRARALGLID